MSVRHIIVQAGGKGTRLKHLTRNRPKALVPVDNLPIIFHLFRTFPEARFVIIGDYKKDVMRKYLAAFADVDYLLVDANGAGTCAGIEPALALIPQGEPFMLIWSDLILPCDIEMPSGLENCIGLSQDFPCRWSYRNGVFEETPSTDAGVAGMFIFKEKTVLAGVPESGEFVRWLQGQEIGFTTIPLRRTKEYGLLETIDMPEGGRCRPFNRMTIDGDKIVKEGIDEQGKQLAVREKGWYRHVEELGFDAIPAIYSYDPFVMERISGKNIFEYDLSFEEKRIVLEKLVNQLKKLHSLESGPVDYFSIKEAYYRKTVDRLNKVRDLVPFADQREIVINGKRCRNVFYCQQELERALDRVSCACFCLIHGDCTFSNMLLRNGEDPILIDPRGYFGHTKMLGDPLYDWAKLYYSLVGNYDQFNLRRFELVVMDSEVSLSIASNGWEDMESCFFELLESEVDSSDIRLIHAIIWLSLTTYAWEDYDSICGSFYNGLLYLEEAL